MDIVLVEAPIEVETSSRPVINNGVGEFKFNCPACGLICKSYSYGCTLVGYSSPEGHDHDDNCRSFNFVCECGANFVLTPINKCPTIGCAWIGKSECSVCGSSGKSWIYTKQILTKKV